MINWSSVLLSGVTTMEHYRDRGFRNGRQLKYTVYVCPQGLTRSTITTRAHSYTSMTSDNVQHVEKCVMEDRLNTVCDISTSRGINTGSVVEILHNHLQIPNLSARWVPKCWGPNRRAKEWQFLVTFWT